jgi:hypothetical protein
MQIIENSFFPSLILATLVAGCAVEPETVAPHDVREQSGARLKIEWWQLASGGVQVRGVYDSQLGTECRFTRGSDGAFACGDVVATFDRQPAAMRVVPTSLSTNDGLVLPIGFYDTQRAVECTPMTTVSGEVRCAPYNADVTADDPILAIASDPADGDRLAPRYMTSADGLHQHLPSFYDRDLAAACSVVAPSTDRTAYCLPSASPGLPLDAYVPAVPSIDP